MLVSTWLFLLVSLIFIFLFPKRRWQGSGKRPWYRTVEGALLITIIFFVVVFIFSLWETGYL
jgi:hypothetical protein